MSPTILPQTNTVVLADGNDFYEYEPNDSFEGTNYWVSPSLARGKNPNSVYTIVEAYVEYEIPSNISSFTFTVRASGNGGASYEESVAFSGLGTASSGVKTLTAVFEAVSGEDPRIKLENFKIGFNVVGLKVKVIEREKL